jgi:ankyrin repeat protein
LLGACSHSDRSPGASTGGKTPDAEKLYPIHIALQSSATDEVVKLLVLQHPATLVNGDNANRVPLSIALRRGSPSSILNLLLSSNPQAASIPDARNFYPLHHACARRIGRDRIELPLLRRLAEAYPDAVHKRNFDGNTPLDLAQSGGLFDDGAINYLHELAYKDDEVVEAPDSYV